MDLTPGLKIDTQPTAKTPLAGVGYSGHIQEELRNGNSQERPSVGKANAVVHQGGGTQSNDSGVIQAPGGNMPGGSAPSVGATESEKMGPKPINPGDVGPSQL